MEQTRFETGMKHLKKIDGIGGENVIKSLEGIAPDVGRFIIEFAFGEIYPREELSLPEREMITITSLLTSGGCELQKTLHPVSEGLLLSLLLVKFIQCIPYVGFPRVLNAITVAKKVFSEKNPKTY